MHDTKMHLVPEELPAFPELARQSLEISPKQKPALLRLGRAKKPITNHMIGYGL
jgi:hypothetical protein